MKLGLFMNEKGGIVHSSLI